MKKIILFFTVFFFLSNCSLRLTVAKQLKPVVDNMQEQVLNEAEEAIVLSTLPFAIKFAESLYYYYPNYYYYAGKLALLYSAYAFAYIDETPLSDFDDEAESKIARINYLYDKAIHYGTIALEKRIPGFTQEVIEKKNIDGFLARIDEEDVETLFWFNFAWAMRLFNDLSDTKRLTNLETIKKIAERIIAIDENYLYGASYAILIVYYGGRVKSLGGDPAKTQFYYEKASKLGKGKSLISDFVYLRFVSILSTDDSIFEKTYQKIAAFNPRINQDFAFVNTFLKRKTQNIYKKKDIFF